MTLCGVHDNMHAHATTVTHTCLPTIPPPPHKQPTVKSDILNKVIDNIMMHYVTDTYNVMFLGDFNIDLLCSKHVFIDCHEVNGLKNIVKEPTCTKGKPSLIDLIVTNKPKRFVNTVSVNTEMSDFHNLVRTSTKFHVKQRKSTTFNYRSYTNFNVDSFTDDLSFIPYHIVDIFDDIDYSYWLWNELTMDVINELAPIKSRTIKGSQVERKFEPQRHAQCTRSSAFFIVTAICKT